jgi:K+-sensing histidine kinase KdpD
VDFAYATAVVAAAALLCTALRGILPVASLALVFVCAVLMVAVRSSKTVAVFAALLSSLIYNYLFTEPRLTLRISSPGDIAAVVTFLLAALAVGHLAGRQREQLMRLRVALANLETSRVESETERLRAALLSSVSHDLRSPLASVIGAASSLTAYGETLGEEDRRALLESIRSESERLDRYIQNLLDMTRLGSGPMKLQRDWVGLEEILGSAETRLRKQFPSVHLEDDIEPGLPPLFVHAALVEQALFNVLENAAKVSPDGAPIRVRARRESGTLTIDVVDRGPGIPEEERKRIFDLFFSSPRGDRAPRGSGLGLTIVRGMIGAHGGKVTAAEGDSGVGTTIRMTLPLNDLPSAEETA